MTKLAVLVEYLTFSYPPWAPDARAPKVFEDAVFSLPSGEERLVMGCSGSGKSTLLYVLMGLAPTYTNGTLNGEVRVCGQDVRATRPSPRCIGMLFQNPAAQLFNNSVEYEIAWGLEMLALPGPEIGVRVTEALHKFDLLPMRNRPPWTLSGGQQKRLALATLWAQCPNVFLLDEPLAGLDPIGRAEVQASLSELRQAGTTFLVTAAHKHEDFSNVSVNVLEDGGISDPVNPVHLSDQRLIKAGVRVQPEAWQALRASHSAIGPSPAIKLRHLNFGYPDGALVLKDLDLTIPQGQFVALVGANGAGKSTLVRHFNGLLRPVSGSIHVLGRPAKDRSIGQLAKDVGFLFQRPERQLFANTVREEIAYGPRQLGLPNVEDRVMQSLAQFDLETLANHPPALLSYGAQRAVTLASLAALDTPILVLDEPMVGLDGRGRTRLLRWLAERRAAGVTLVVITHEMDLAACADRLVALHAGRIVVDGSPVRVMPRLPWGDLHDGSAMQADGQGDSV